MGAFILPEPKAARAGARGQDSGLGAAFGTGMQRLGRSRTAWPSPKVGSRERDNRAAPAEAPLESVRKRHSDITAYGVRVEVFCYFQPSSSRPEENLYYFYCNIRVTNTNPTDIQLLSRELRIHKVDGSPPEYGPASQLLENQPVIAPGATYLYNSEFGITCVPEDKRYLGRIEGHFDVAVREENTIVKVPIAPFWLEIPGDTLVLA
jgi:uncharacterized protein affecting Mg2+/Co2+ transport